MSVGTAEKIREFLKLMLPYWRSEDKYKAWGILSLILAINIASVYLTVVFNTWYVEFYNSLQTLNKPLFIDQCYMFAQLAVLLIATFVLTRYLTAQLAFRWRSWLTQKYLGHWLDNNMHYRLTLENEKTDNPDQRIAQDLASFSTSVLSLSLSIFKETLTFFSFIVVLWNLSSPLNFSIGEQKFSIPAYIVWAMLLYVLVGTYVVLKIGKPIIKLDFDQEKFEANFRFHLIRLRERSEEVALYNGGATEEVNFRNSFQAIKNNFRKIVVRNVYINGWQNFYLNCSTLFPILAASPMFFSGAITLGVLMQINGAFDKVKDSLSILVMDYQIIAQLVATTRRITGFSSSMQKIKQQTAHNNDLISKSLDNKTETLLQVKSHHPCQSQVSAYDGIRVFKGKEDCLVLENLSLYTPNGISLIQNLNLTIPAGERLLLMGASGLGKTTLIRAIADLWPFGTGSIHLPPHAVFIVPQKPYMPIGTIREGLLYPNNSDSTEMPLPSEETFVEVLRVCRLEHLQPYLDETRDWGLQLSIGEQQRIIFARALIRKPSWIIMDEPTASMDKQTEAQVYSILHQYMPNATLITIGHSPTLKAFHQRVIELRHSDISEINIERNEEKEEERKLA